ncbi:MAG: hypothetical protein COB14_01555 [Alphaproteobacteria bacterium]|nr:MAG: hypothetical protein COB14_01555 [Alphaproteobacteria bacterium]
MEFYDNGWHHGEEVIGGGHPICEHILPLVEQPTAVVFYWNINAGIAMHNKRLDLLVLDYTL